MVGTLAVDAAGASAAGVVSDAAATPNPLTAVFNRVAAPRLGRLRLHLATEDLLVQTRIPLLPGKTHSR